MSVKFKLPSTFSKDIESKFTIKEYTRRLNHIAQRGLDSPEALLVRGGLNKAVEIIEALVPGDEEKDKTSKRFYVAAIHWVLPLAVRQKKTNPLYKFWNKKALPETNLATGGAWQPRKDYKPPAE